MQYPFPRVFFCKHSNFAFFTRANPRFWTWKNCLMPLYRSSLSASRTPSLFEPRKWRQNGLSDNNCRLSHDGTRGSRAWTESITTITVEWDFYKHSVETWVLARFERPLTQRVRCWNKWYVDAPCLLQIFMTWSWRGKPARHAAHGKYAVMTSWMEFVSTVVISIFHVSYHQITTTVAGPLRLPQTISSSNTGRGKKQGPIHLPISLHRIRAHGWSLNTRYRAVHQSTQNDSATRQVTRRNKRLSREGRCKTGQQWRFLYLGSPTCSYLSIEYEDLCSQSYI